MPPRSKLRLASSLVLLAGVSVATAASPVPDERADVEFYELHIRPLLAAKCGDCHGPDLQRAGLRLDTGGLALTGGERGAALVPGDPEASLLVRAVRYEDADLAMPPKGKLREDEIELLVEWVRRGAPHPSEEVEVAAVDADSAVITVLRDDGLVGYRYEVRAADWAP